MVQEASVLDTASLVKFESSREGVQHSTMLNIPASGPSSPGFDSLHSQFFLAKKIVDVAEVNQWRC